MADPNRNENLRWRKMTSTRNGDWETLILPKPPFLHLRCHCHPPQVQLSLSLPLSQVHVNPIGSAIAITASTSNAAAITGITSRTAHKSQCTELHTHTGLRDEAKAGESAATPHERHASEGRARCKLEVLSPLRRRRFG